ncbi:conserved membrane hypothetical protein [Verrucomicrobia bacterium]|nr:conserved membrane hypothetical protein [Verrucomicrobiota bacterium]
MGEHTDGLLVRIISVVFFVAAIGTVIAWTVKKAEDPARMIFKWVLTAPLLGYVFWVLMPMLGKFDNKAAINGIPNTVLCGLALAIIWRSSIAALIARPFGSLFTGGDEPPEPQPLYSVARARQKRGRYAEAVAEIRRQLDRFPNDLEGHLLLAQIQAEDLKDLPAAELTLRHFCEQPGHAPQNVAFALYSLADWHLKINQDREAARRELEKIVELYPDSELALGAAQRIAHLGSTEMLLAPHEQKKFAVPEAPRNLGLISKRYQPQPRETDPAEEAAQYVKHLEAHPLDTEAREHLAVIYADHYQRLDLATDQLEQMIDQPHQPARLVTHWLNLLADLQVRSGVDYESVRQTLQRIIDRNPNLAAAEIARKRLGLLKLELKGQAAKDSVKLGEYEQKIGLKGRGPRRDS